MWFCAENNFGSTRPNGESSLAACIFQNADSYKSEHEKEGIEGTWRTITDDPIDYHFYYHILDGEEGGRPPKLNITPGREKQTENNHFSWRDRRPYNILWLECWRKQNGKVMDAFF